MKEYTKLARSPHKQLCLHSTVRQRAELPCHIVLPFSCNLHAQFKEGIESLISAIWIRAQCRRMKAFSSAKNSSIGFRSGEYGGKYTSLTPASKHVCSIRSE
jgi:hypothetical protein